jgi:hypothetical protein
MNQPSSAAVIGGAVITYPKSLGGKIIKSTEN